MGDPLLVCTLGFEDTESLCVAWTSCKAQLENIPQSVHGARIARCVHTPVSGTVLPAVFTAVIAANHSAIYSLQSGSIGDRGYTFVQKLDKDKGAPPLIQQFTSPQS